MKRQTSWQEDIARNFSRMFLRSKSQDHEKSEEGSVSPNGQENEVSSGGDPSLLQEDLDLSKAFQSAEEERRGAKRDRSERAEEGDGEGAVAGGGERSVSGDAGGTSEDQPPAQSPADSSPCSQLGPSGPVPPTTPTHHSHSPPVETSFLKRLGSLFLFKAEPRISPPQEEQRKVKEEEGVEGEERTAADLSGMTCGADGDQGHCDITKRRTEDEDTPQTGVDSGWRVEKTVDIVQRFSLSETDLERSSSSRLGETDAQTSTNRTTGDSHAEDDEKGCGEGEESDSGTLKDGELTAEDRRRLALSSPPVVTYGTYRGQREQRRMRRRHQVASPILEGDENQQDRGSACSSPLSTPHVVRPQGTETPSPSELAKSNPADLQPSLTNPITAPASEIIEKEAQTLKKDCAVLGPTGPSPSFSDIPVATRLSNCRVGIESASSSYREGDMAANTADSQSGSELVKDTPLEPRGTPANGKTSAWLSETHYLDPNPLDETSYAAGTGEKHAHRDLGEGRTEQTETLSALSAQTGSPSLVAAWLSEPGGAGGTACTHLSAAVSNDSQLAPLRISLSGSLAAEEDGQPMPTTRDSDSRVVLDTASHAGLNYFASRGIEEGVEISEGVLSEDLNSYEEALRLESKIMLENILRNALIALEGIQSPELQAETLQSASKETKTVSALPIESLEGFGHTFEPDKLLGVSLSDDRHDTHSSAASREQNLSSTQVLVEGLRSTPSSGYESIAGSDTDIRSSPGLTWESSSTIGSGLSVLDEMHGEHCPEGTTNTGNLTEVKGQELIDVNMLSVDSQPGSNSIRSEFGAGEVEGGKLDLMRSHGKQGLHRDGDISRIAKAGDKSEQHQSVSISTNENKGQVDHSARDRDNNEAQSTGKTQIADSLVSVAKDETESNRLCHNQTCVECDNVTLPNNRGDPDDLDGCLNNTAPPTETPGKHIAFPHSPVMDSTCEAKNICESNFMTVKANRTQQASEVRHTESDDVIDTHNKAPNSYAGSKVESVQKAPQTETIRLNESKDHSFVLVETYLAAVIEDDSDSGGEEDGAHRLGSTVPVDPTSSQRPPEDLHSSEELAFNLAPGSTNGDRPRWSSARATRYDVSAEHPLQDSQTQGHSVSAAAAEAVAMAGLHQDLSSRLSGLHTWGGRKGGHLPDLTSCTVRAQGLGPLPLPLLDLHEVEASGFAIIDEEEETDSVFINDTGPMLSPTSRRAKAYPFSLSPIVEEESLRGDGEEAGEGGLSREDRGLQVPPATEEELRSLSGGGGAEQQVSTSSLSILSLLQSVSERLQSSAFSDSGEDLDGSSSPPLQRPLWECFFNRNQGEEYGEVEDGQPQPIDDVQRFPLYPPCNRQEGPDSHVIGSISNLDGFAIGRQDECSVEEKNNGFSPQITLQKPMDTAFYQYLKSSEAKLVKKLGERCPSVKTSEDEDHRFSKMPPRPTLMCIYDGTTFSGDKREIHTDQEDAGIVFTHGASVRVLGGCWLLYLEPGFKGPGVVLEEGETVLTHQPGRQTTQEDKPTAITIGSIRRLVKDDCTPEIHLCPTGAAPQATECIRYQTDSLETHGPVHLSNLSVQSGCWLAYDNPSCHGDYVVMEAGGLSTSGPGQPQVTSVRSLRPLKRGGLKVRRPLDPKMLVFEQPLFQGRGRELLGHTPLMDTAAGLKGASSLRVIGGAWVGYDGEGYTGRQYLLEEGEYGDCEELGGAHHPCLLSFRFLQADFIEPSLSLQQGAGSPPSAEKANLLDLDIPDLEMAGASGKNTSICVKNGVWVAYSERGFCGEQFILEKGKHPSTLDFSVGRQAARSIRPVRLEMCGTGEPKHLLKVYSKPRFEGAAKELEEEVLNWDNDTPMSIRVIRGNWLLFEDEGCCGNQYVLGEGLYPDLISCGFATTSVKSLRPIPYNFSDPSLCLFSLDSFEGVKTVTVTSMDSMNDIFTQSLRVDGGMWVAWEYAHYKGRQMLLQPGQVPKWGDHSGWDTIGSLRPLKQPRVYVQLRSRPLGSVVTVEDVQGDPSPARVSLSPSRSLDTQRWALANGLLRCKASKGCLSVIGAKAIAGTRVAVWPEHGRTHQRWSLNHNGTISSHLNHNLVLDCRGGTGFDKDHLVVNEFSSDKPTQYWDIELL